MSLRTAALYRINDVLTSICNELEAEWPSEDTEDTVLDAMTHYVAATIEPYVSALHRN